jgi:hypothetical protein
VTVTERAPNVAFEATDTTTVNCDDVLNATEFTVIPVPENATVAPLTNPVPATVNDWLAAPRPRDAGVTDTTDNAAEPGFTVWATPALTLAAKFASPPYPAVNDFTPADVDTNEHEPAATAAEHDTEPSDTVTTPDGVPAPGATTLTLQPTTYD